MIFLDASKTVSVLLSFSQSLIKYREIKMPLKKMASHLFPCDKEEEISLLLFIALDVHNLDLFKGRY